MIAQKATTPHKVTKKIGGILITLAIASSLIYIIYATAGFVYTLFK